MRGKLLWSHNPALMSIRRVEIADEVKKSMEAFVSRERDGAHHIGGTLEHPLVREHEDGLGKVHEGGATCTARRVKRPSQAHNANGVGQEASQDQKPRKASAAMRVNNFAWWA
jgi:hypothetical protein